MADIADIFTKLINTLIAQSKSTTAGHRNTAGLKNESMNLSGTIAPYFDEAAVRQAFSRSELWQNYIDSFENGKAAYLVMAAKLQNDVVAAVERDFKLQRSTRVQALARSLSRRNAHGSDNGVIRSVLAYEPQALLDTGASSNSILAGGPDDASVQTGPTGISTEPIGPLTTSEALA